MQKAVNAFEQAIADKTYFLSDSASVDYQRAVARRAPRALPRLTQVMPAVAYCAATCRAWTWRPTAPCRVRRRRTPYA